MLLDLDQDRQREAHGESGADPYRGVVFVLLAIAIACAAGCTVARRMLVNPIFDVLATTLELWAGMLIGVAIAQALRARGSTFPQIVAEISRLEAITEEPADDSTPRGAIPAPEIVIRRLKTWTAAALTWLGVRLRKVSPVDAVRFVIVALGLIVTGLALPTDFVVALSTPVEAAVTAASCLAAAGLIAISARYFAGIAQDKFPESRGLSQASRVIAWVLALVGFSCLTWLLPQTADRWQSQQTGLQAVFYLVGLLNAGICVSLLAQKRSVPGARAVFPTELGIFSVLGSRASIFASVLDAAERQLGIDLRSTWALVVVRRSLEPLLTALILIGWLSTSITVVGLDEQGLVERLGVPIDGPPLPPGINLHLPWPIDRVWKASVLRIHALTVGHEGAEESGPENVLWARAHAANEFTLLLGNGRDLVTIDATVQFRIADVRAWRYGSQNPADALKAIAYRAVMRSTVNKTLSEALSENVAILTGQMRAMVQNDADHLGLGVEITAFTLGGMHPPVPVSSAYQGVISAEIRKTTAVVNAQNYANQALFANEGAVVTETSAARAEGAEELGKAAGEAWSFRALEAGVQASPEEYFFRRRLEALEKGLAVRRFTVVDRRIERDGGQLWLIP